MLNTEDENSTRFESALDVPDVEYLQSDTDTGKTDGLFYIELSWYLAPKPASLPIATIYRMLTH